MNFVFFNGMPLVYPVDRFGVEWPIEGLTYFYYIGGGEGYSGLGVA